MIEMLSRSAYTKWRFGPAYTASSYADAAACDFLAGGRGRKACRREGLVRGAVGGGGSLRGGVDHPGRAQPDVRAVVRHGLGGRVGRRGGLERGKEMPRREDMRGFRRGGSPPVRADWGRSARLKSCSDVWQLIATSRLRNRPRASLPGQDVQPAPMGAARRGAPQGPCLVPAFSVALRACNPLAKRPNVFGRRKRACVRWNCRPSRQAGLPERATHGA